MNADHLVNVSVDLSRVRDNAVAIRNLAGTDMIAVVKADAYGLGAAAIAATIGDLVDAFYVFHSDEAVSSRLWDIAGKRTIALNSDWADPKDFKSHHIAPVVWTAERAAALRVSGPILSIDTGQQRFAAPVHTVVTVQRAGDCKEMMTHAVSMLQVEQFSRVTHRWKDDGLFRHAAGSALLDQPLARFDAVRPGLSLYRGAVRVVATLVDARDSTGPAGYTGFETQRFGVILAGYSSGMRPGPCLVNGRQQRVLEVGMQSSFVELAASDQAGDEVVLLGNQAQVDELSVAKAWRSSPQEVLVRLTKMGPLKYCHGRH